MKSIKFTVTNIIGLIIICISFIPLYNRYLTHLRDDRFDFSAQTLVLEYFLVIVLGLLLLIAKKYSINNAYAAKIRFLTFSIIIYILLTFISALLSQDVSRSLSLFAFGSIGPMLLYLIIAYKIPASTNNLKYFVSVFIISNVLYLLVAYLFAFRHGFTTDLLATRTGKNIYGSNSVIGAISFMLPLIFINRKKLVSLVRKNIYLRLFGLMALVWIIISLSRWGYATAMLTFLLTAYSINKSLSLRNIMLIILVFSIVAYIIPDVSELIIFRFTGSSSLDSFTLENILDVTLGEGRLLRWENAFDNVIGKNLLFGIGLGNNYLVDLFGNSDAHNLFINMLIEQGLLAFMAILLVLTAIYQLVKKISKTTANQNIKVLVLSLGIGILIFHFWSITGGTYIQAGGIISAVKNYYFFIAMGIIAYTSKLEGQL